MEAILTLLGKVALCAACLTLTAGLADAKPDKNKGGNKGGQSEKHQGGGNKGSNHPGNKGDNGKPDQDAGKAMDKHLKETAKWNGEKFRDSDRTRILDYFSQYKGNDRGLPPGLAKNLQRGKPLPPGWQNKVNEGYLIEDGWRDYFHPMEYSLFPGLAPTPETRLYLFGNRLVRVHEPTRRVIDAITIPSIPLN